MDKLPAGGPFQKTKGRGPWRRSFLVHSSVTGSRGALVPIKQNGHPSPRGITRLPFPPLGRCRLSPPSPLPPAKPCHTTSTSPPRHKRGEAAKTTRKPSLGIR